MINWRLGSTKPGWPSSIVFMTPLTIFIVHICGSSCKSPSMSHNTPRILWSALRDNSMLISHPFHSQVRELTHTLQFYAAPLPWETFLHREPLLRIQITPCCDCDISPRLEGRGLLLLTGERFLLQWRLPDELSPERV